MRLKPKMTLLLALPVAAGMLVLSACIALTIFRDVRGLYLQMLDGVVRARAAEIGRWAQIYLKTVKMNALSPEMRSADPGRIRPFLMGRQAHLDSDQVDEFFATREGVYFNSVNSTGNIADREYVKAILSGRAEHFVSDGLASRDTGKNIVTFSAAVKGAVGEIVGVSGTAVSLDTLSQIAASARIGAGYGSILDGRFTVIAHPDPAYVMKLNLVELEKAGYRELERSIMPMRARESGHMPYIDSHGSKTFLAFAPVPFTTWSMAVSVPLSQVDASASKIIAILAALSVAILAALVASISASVDRILRPITALSALVQRMAAGELHFVGREDSLADPPRDEIGLLARSFDLMALRLSDTLEGYDSMNKTLADRNKELEAAKGALERLNAELEDRVKERTASLEAANLKLEGINGELEHALVALQQAQGTIEVSAKMAVLGRLASGIAHELNTPLGAIRSSSAFALDALDEILPVLLPAYSALSPERKELLAALLRRGSARARGKDLPEHRMRKKALVASLRAKGIDRAYAIADDVSTLGAFDMEDQIEALLLSGDESVLGVAARLTEILRAEAIVLEAADKASSTVAALADYSRLDELEHKVRVYPVAEIETLVTLYYDRLKRSIALERRFLSADPVLGYRDRLNQLWVNLMNNALQAMEYEGVLEIETSREGDEIVVSFTDSGPGIPELVKPKIFTPFFTTKRPGEGTGLGLDLCRRIVERHGGRIGFESRPGRTTFWVRLPAADARGGEGDA